MNLLAPSLTCHSERNGMKRRIHLNCLFVFCILHLCLLYFIFFLYLCSYFFFLVFTCIYFVSAAILKRKRKRKRKMDSSLHSIPLRMTSYRWCKQVHAVSTSCLTGRCRDSVKKPGRVIVNAITRPGFLSISDAAKPSHQLSIVHF